METDMEHSKHLSPWGLTQAFLLIKFAEKCFTDHEVPLTDFMGIILLGLALTFTAGFVVGFFAPVEKNISGGK
jgi:hypothetical protein